MDDLRLVLRTPDFVEATLVRGLLEEAGIGVLEANTVDFYAMTWRFTEFGYLRLCVPAAEADNARALIADFRREAAAGALALEDFDATVPPRRGFGEAVVLLLIWVNLLGFVVSIIISAVYSDHLHGHAPAQTTKIYLMLRSLFRLTRH